MIKSTDTLYFHTMHSIPSHYQESLIWKNIRQDCGKGGQFFIDIATRFHESRFVSRNNGEWSLPWKQDIIPDFKMPEYDPTFNKTFEQVSDECAIEIKKLIHQGQKFALMYAGGFDSTVVLVALLKNLTTEELASVALCTSIHSVIEYPDFWAKHIHGKFKIIDSVENWYDHVIAQGYRPITADEGDCVFGTMIGLQVYNNYDLYLSRLSPESQSNLKNLKYKISSGDVHYSVFKDLIISTLAHEQTPNGLEFGRILYEKYVRNIDTSPVPIHSLHDFYWWLIFNVKYLNCSVRGAIFYNSGLPIRECIDVMVNWFNATDYQLWSMVNNNNGKKIQNTVATYKYEARQYIRNFTNDDWHFYFKTKLDSLVNIKVNRGESYKADHRFLVGLDKDYNRLLLTDQSVIAYFTEHLINYKIDWTD
jgi:hypothetical protein